MLDKFLEVIDEEREQEFIANFYNDISKYELRTILLSYLCAIHAQDKGFEDDCREYVREELEDATCKL